MQAPYFWLTDVLTQWQRLYINQRLHHALLLIGAKGNGRNVALHQFAKLLLCEHPQEAEPCQHCHSCELFDAKTHPDLYILQSEQPGKPIGIDAVRATNEFAWKTSSVGRQRVIMIKSAENMTEGAANALLKTLEEPPENCQFLLYADAVDRLLPTIISRCSKWYLSPPPEKEVLDWLSKQLSPAQQPHLSIDILRLNAGAPLATLAFIQEEQYEKLADLFQSFWYFIQQEGLADFTEFARLCEQSFPQSLHWLSCLLADILKYKQGAQAFLMFQHYEKQLHFYAQHLDQNLVFQQYKALNLLLRNFTEQTGLNKNLLLGQWLLSFFPE